MIVAGVWTEVGFSN